MTAPKVPLRRLFEIVNGGTPTADAENWGGDVPWATPTDLALVDGQTIDDTQRTLTLSGLRSGSRLVPTGSLLVSTRAPVGYVAQTAQPMTFNQGCRGLVARSPHVCTAFFKYLLLSQRADLQAASNGTTFQELSTDGLGSTRVCNVPVARQERIAARLDAETARIDALIDAKQQMIRVTGERLRCALDATIVSVVASSVPLRRFITSLDQGTSSQAGTAPASGSEWGILKLSAVKWGRFVPGENKVVPPDHPIDQTLRPAPGDLLVTRSNTPAYVGDVCAVTEPSPQVLLPDLIYRVRLDADRLDTEFASMALRTSPSRHLLSASGRGTSQSMVKLRGEDIGAVTVPAPPLQAQKDLVRRFARTSERADAIVASLSQQIALLTERRQAVITAAVAGELDD